MAYEDTLATFAILEVHRLKDVDIGESHETIEIILHPEDLVSIRPVTEEQADARAIELHEMDDASDPPDLADATEAYVRALQSSGRGES